MRIRGLDFTSSSSGKKSNHLVEGRLEGHELWLEEVHSLVRAAQLEDVLAERGSWVLGGET